MAPIKHGGNDRQKIKSIGRKVSNLVAAMLFVSITLVVVICVLMFYRLTMSMMQNECVSATNVLAHFLFECVQKLRFVLIAGVVCGQLTG